MFIYFAKSKGVVANKKALQGSGHDTLVYITVIQMVFTVIEVEASVYNFYLFVGRQ